MATKDDLKAEVDLAVQAMQHEMAGLAARSDRIEARITMLAKLATKEELGEAVSTLATKKDIQELGRQIAALAPRRPPRS